MIGEEYLEWRSQLASALSLLTALAHDVDADVETRQMIHELSKSLDEPFLFVVVGEVKAGKSSLLNAMFGREFCRVDVLPATDKIYFFKYGAREQNVNVSERLAECYRPHRFLKDFNIVDTPGTNTIVEQHQTITEKFLPRADLVLFVFSVVNPWAASAWEFLNFVHGKWLKNVVFVVQQADLREPVEVDAVVNHLDRTAQQKLGRKIPIFPVSARKAFDARNGALDGDRLLAESKLPALEKYIDDSVAEGVARIDKLLSICRSCQVTVGQLTEKARAASEVVRTDLERLEELGAALAERKEVSRRQIGGVLYALSQSYEKAQRRGEELLRQRLSFGQTLRLVFRKADWQRDFQADIQENLKETFHEQIEKSLELMEDDLRSVWQGLHETLQEHFPKEIKRPATAPDLIERRSALLRRIELTLVEKMQNRQVDQQMQKMFAETANLLRVPAGVAAAAGGAAAIATALAHGAFVDVTGTIAGLAAVFGTVAALMKRQSILNQFAKEMSNKREEVLSAIESQLYHAIDLFYQELDQTFQPLRSFCVAQRQVYGPILERAESLDQTLGKIAADLGHKER